MAYTPPGETRRRVYEFVRQRLLAGEPPTIREVQEAFDFRSVESARVQLEMLVREGRLVKTPGRSRGYRLPDRDYGGTASRGRRGTLRAPVLVPLLGRVQAGQLTTAVQEADGYLVVDHRPNPDELFALKVRGESMSGAGILPGDIVIVRRQQVARTGDIVVALVTGVEDEATIKTFRRDRTGRVTLQPENPRFEPIAPVPGTLQILGKVIEVRRYVEPA